MKMCKFQFPTDAISTVGRPNRWTVSSETVFRGLFSEGTLEVNFYEFFQSLTTHVSLGV